MPLSNDYLKEEKEKKKEEYKKLYNKAEEWVKNSEPFFFQSGYHCYFYRDADNIGVAIPTRELLEIQKVFPVKIFEMRSRTAWLPNMTGNFLTLSVPNNPDTFDLTTPGNLSLFLGICIQFVTENRNDLLADPKQWAKKMIKIFGNESSDKRPYPYIAEFHLLRELDKAGLIRDIDREYRGPEYGIHDFELENFSLEVKSHLHAQPDNKRKVTISSDKQLEKTSFDRDDEKKPLYLVYYEMEGGSGDLSLKQCINGFGDKRGIVLEKLEKLAFYEGDLYWESPYHLVGGEPMVYPVDDQFPRITSDKFVGGATPSGVDELTYTVSLANLRHRYTLSEFIKAKQAGREPEYYV